MFLCRGEYENRISRRLFQCLKERVEGCCREHVHLVYDEDAVLAVLRLHTHFLYKLPYVLDRVVGCGVKLMDIERTLLVE